MYYGTNRGSHLKTVVYSGTLFLEEPNFSIITLCRGGFEIGTEHMELE